MDEDAELLLPGAATYQCTSCTSPVQVESKDEAVKKHLRVVRYDADKGRAELKVS